MPEVEISLELVGGSVIPMDTDTVELKMKW